jgi:CRISPR-associated protein Csb3
VSIRIDTEPTNPGQFFACCGLLEVADRLWNCAEGWFEANTFCIRAAKAEASLLKLLAAARDFRLLGRDDASPDRDEDEQEDGVDNKAESFTIVSPISLRLDWWEDKSIKTWAGSMNARKIFLAMCNAIDSQNAVPFSQSGVVFDAQTPGSAKGKNSKSAKKREPFYFDGWRGASAKPIDVGFSTDPLMNTLVHPVVEALCFVGLQRCRPRPTQTPRVFDYVAWRTPLPISIAPAAVSGLIGDGDCFRFANDFRTDQRKHKAFMPAARIPRSSL